MKDLQFESISGVNLPMLIEALDSRNNYNLEDLVDKVIQIGIDGIKNIRNELTEKKAMEFRRLINAGY